LLFLGDELGFVRVQDISMILTNVPNLRPIHITSGDKKRNPHLVLDEDFDSRGKYPHEGSSEDQNQEEFQDKAELPFVDES
jgi:hypothetical protein